MLNRPSKDFTKQEKLVSEVLSEMGIRYQQQKRFYRKELNKIGKLKNPFTVDLFLSDDNIIIECDNGTVNHSKKANEKRDEELLSLGVEKIIHIKSYEKEDIKKELEGYFGD